jgi:hypothetical protein
MHRKCRDLHLAESVETAELVFSDQRPELPVDQRAIEICGLLAGLEIEGVGQG